MVLGSQPNIFSPKAGQRVGKWKEVPVPDYGSVSHKYPYDANFEGFGKLESGTLSGIQLYNAFKYRPSARRLNIQPFYLPAPLILLLSEVLVLICTLKETSFKSKLAFLCKREKSSWNIRLHQPSSTRETEESKAEKERWDVLLLLPLFNQEVGAPPFLNAFNNQHLFNQGMFYQCALAIE